MAPTSTFAYIFDINVFHSVEVFRFIDETRMDSLTIAMLWQYRVHMPCMDTEFPL